MISREDLYALVWSEPMARLSRRFGMSDVGLAKACARMMIPVPGRGYWAKKEVGRAPRPTRLPALPASAGPQMREMRVQRREAPTAAESAGDEVASIQVDVPEVLTDPHPLVAKSVKAFRGGKSQHDGYLMPKTPDCLAVVATMGTIDRAMRIYDGVIKTIEARGHTVEIRKGKREGYVEPVYRTVVLIEEEEVEIGIREITQRVERSPEKKAKFYSEYEFVPSGRLAIWIQYDRQSRWSDDARHTLESQLGKFVRGIAVTALRMKDDRRRREEYDRQQLEAQRRQQEEAERRRAEAARVRALNAAIDRMRAASWVREYLAQLRENLNAYNEADTPEMQNWLAWVEGYAQRIDPSLTPAVVPKDPNPYG
jgi:hypothetical protein